MTARAPIAVTLWFLLGALCTAAEYPQQPVRIVVPVAAGGGVDVMARLLAVRLAQQLHQQFVVENRAGAAGVIGSRFVAASPPDGTTLLYTPSSLSLSVLINKPPPYDLVRDFTPIVNVAISPYALAVSPLLPVRSLDELLAHARSNPGRLSYGSAGIGSASHMAAELLKLRTGIDMVHVPNKGMNPALIDLIGNQVQVLFASVPGLTAEHSGRLKVLAMAERKRSALMPEVPTMAEAGVPDFAVANWAGLLGPAGLDPLIVQRLHDEVRAILATADMQERIAALGFDVIAAGPQEFAGQLLDDLERWGPVAKAAGADQR